MDSLELFLDRIYLNHSSLAFNLQRFASAEAEGRTEKATEHKKRKAREEGRVALSKELPASIITIAGISVIAFLAKYFLEEIVLMTRYTFENVATLELTEPDLIFNLMIYPFLKIFLPVAITIFVIAIIANYGQIGFKISTKALKPDFKKILPDLIKFVKNQILSPQGAFNLVKSIIKVLIIFAMAYLTITGQMENIKLLMFEESMINALILISKVTFELIMKASIILFVFAFVDFMFVRWHFEESLKMKKEEIKEEQKELYGDPQVKAKIKQAYQTIMSQQKMLKEVPNADVVITNPDHYAVAIRYNRSFEEAPRVIAKGEDEFAQKIKAVARANNIYTYENVMLARQLYASVEINEIVPKEYWGFIVTALKLAYEFGEKRMEPV